ncbi:MAG: radical SAM protein [Proteobacteria bacterium]|nr:radical SAM protein [Pseudomonadota bacterium]MBU1060576.1 radical SAM protein [Pseudomonadota bacterium]
MSKKNEKFSHTARPVKEQKHRSSAEESLLASSNFMGAATFGSFSWVGEHTTEFPPSRSVGSYLAVELGEACNLRCRHCIYGQQHQGNSPPNPIVIESLKDACRNGLAIECVSYAGKEPTMYPEELQDLAKTLRQQGRVTEVMTNGTNPEALLPLIGLVDFFDISLDGDQSAHDWMRGPGTYQKTFKTIEQIINASAISRVGVIATLVHSVLADGRKQGSGIISLANELERAFGETKRVSLTISLYYGNPDDPMLLNTEDILTAIMGLRDVGLSTRLVLTAGYAHLWPELRKMLRAELCPLEYDVPSGIPLMRIGNLSILLFNLTPASLNGFRICNNGKVYLSCNHLAVENEASRVQCEVGDLASNSLNEIINSIESGENPVIQTLSQVSETCFDCSEWEHCHSGDRLSGLLFKNEPVDPYCHRIMKNRRIQ